MVVSMHTLSARKAGACMQWGNSRAARASRNILAVLASDRLPVLFLWVSFPSPAHLP